MEFNPLPDLLNTGFRVIEIGSVYGGEHLKHKYADSDVFDMVNFT